MPVRKVGKDCYQWGNQKVYCGTDAQRKAILQGIAIENTGWKEAETARDFAKKKHEGQMYDDETPYMTHVDGVAGAFEDEHLKNIAYLHDVVEDTDVTIEEIRERFGEDVSRAVDALTRRKGEQYFDYIHRVKQHPEATQVKLADLHYNLNENTKPSLAKRNRKAMRILTHISEAEEINMNTVPNIGLTIPIHFGGIDGDRKMWLHNGHFLIGTTEDGRWGVYDLDRNDFVGWNYAGFPLTEKYWAWWKDNEGLKREYWHLLTLEDAILLADWSDEKDKKRADKFNQGADDLSTSFMSKTQRRALKMKMNRDDNEMARHPNRSTDWIPMRLIKEKAQEVREGLKCPTCGENRFGTLVAAKRHHFYCDKYGFQPPNQLYFTPISYFVAKSLHKKGKSINDGTGHL